MGCYNITCNLSNLPIQRHESVVLIPVYKRRQEQIFHCCYPDDNFTPFCPPIVGRYNEYGGIELKEDEIPDLVKEFLKNLSFNCYLNENGDCISVNEWKSIQNGKQKVIKYDDCSSLEDFVNRMIDNSSSYCYLSGKENFEISYMMMHCDLYNRLVNEIANRRVYESQETYKNKLFNEYKECVDAKKETFARYKNMLNCSGLDDSSKNMILLNSRLDIIDLSKDLFDINSLHSTRKWEFFVKAMIGDESLEEEVLNMAVEKTLFYFVLSAMRKAYGPNSTSGNGSQSAETRLHMILANFIRDKVIGLEKEKSEYEEGYVINYNGYAADLIL